MSYRTSDAGAAAGWIVVACGAFVVGWVLRRAVTR